MGIGLTLFRVDRTQRNQPQEQQWRRDQTAPREARRDLARVAAVVLVVGSSGPNRIPRYLGYEYLGT